jgi:hypothetical protein
MPAGFFRFPNQGAPAVTTRTSYAANGNITVCSFVKLDPSATLDHGIILCSANTDRPFGISTEGAYSAPTGNQPNPNYAANAPVGGEYQSCRCYLVGEECLIIAGTGGLTVGDLVTSDANGHGVTAAAGAGVWYGAECLETVAAGSEARVIVRQGILRT